MKRVKKYYKKMGFEGVKLYLHRKFKISSQANVFIPDSDSKIALRCRTSDIDIFEQIFIEEEYHHDFQYEPKTIIDAGANIGLSAIYYAKKYPNAKIIALEPESDNFSFLKKNTISYKNIIPLKKGLWYKDAYLKIVNPDGRNFAFYLEEAEEENFDIEAVTIDGLMKQYHFNHIDILKIDIEGSEKEVFSAASAWIDKVSMVAIELHDHLKAGCSRAFYTAVDKYVHEEKRRGENVIMTLKTYQRKCSDLNL